MSVTAREAANAYHGQPQDVRTIGEELRVRYVLKGNMRRLGTTLRVNIRLISAETGALLWSDRFDEEIGEPGAGQDQIVRRVKDELGIRLIDIESARSRSERPTDPDAFDLVLRVRSIRNQPPSLPRDREVMALLERALALDPSFGLCDGPHCILPVQCHWLRWLAGFCDDAACRASVGAGSLSCS